ncbi:hypothetical protein G5C51_05740 [Streptomyces sp. A7024]|uniref:Uncharacterized protein n=1 Tax=Streptomyces coryli TaxID=1128680 RepID=A0A6G4TVD9_9ACTN|nr:hypothetical protein [Streptomyces coryli]NGN63406.1 hypothetical protein [Streptomyces coryli]
MAHHLPEFFRLSCRQDRALLQAKWRASSGHRPSEFASVWWHGIPPGDRSGTADGSCLTLAGLVAPAVEFYGGVCICIAVISDLLEIYRQFKLVTIEDGVSEYEPFR